MGFGGGSQTPDPEPIPQPPTRDDPRLIDVERQAANKAKAQDGYSKHLLAGGSKGDTSSVGSKPKQLLG